MTISSLAAKKLLEKADMLQSAARRGAIDIFEGKVTCMQTRGVSVGGVAP